MTHSPIRLLLAAVTVACGLYAVAQAAGSRTTIAEGLGLVAAGVGLVAP